MAAASSSRPRRKRSTAARSGETDGPAVAWKPASGAVSYDVEWSRTSYPWRPAGHQRTYSTSAMLPLSPGIWWYRVRGINPYLAGNTKLAWSTPLHVEIAKPTFSVSGG